MEQQNQHEMPAKVTQGDGKVFIEFNEKVPNDVVKEQIEACEQETCTCCTPEFRDEVESFKIIENDNQVNVEIIGTISAEHVKENLISCAPKLKK
jgi:hypothetical protein